MGDSPSQHDTSLSQNHQLHHALLPATNKTFVTLKFNQTTCTSMTRNEKNNVQNIKVL